MKLAFRQLAKSPGFTAITVLTLALGIGACTAIFSIVNSVLLRPLAYPEADRLVVIRETKLPQITEFSVAPGNYFDWRAQATSFEHLAGMRSLSYALTGVGEPVRVAARRVTPNYFSLLRTPPVLGRDFADADGAAKSDLAILSHGFWLRQFGGRAEVLGQTIQLGGQPFTIVGVMPENFQRGSGVELFTPIDYAAENQNHGSHTMQVFGRLKPGITPAEAQRELALIAGRLAQQYPETNTGWSVRLDPMLEATVGAASPMLWALCGAVGFLLLIACANIANLLLARSTARAKEMAVRTALGASRGRIVRQLLAESVLLALLGGALGVLFAHWGMAALLAFAGESLPRSAEIALDVRALGFASALMLVAGIGFGLAPAFQASRVNPNEALKDGGRGTSGSGRRQRLRSALVITEVALALMLLVGAGLFARSFAHLQSKSPGFEPGQSLAIALNLSGTKYGTEPQRAAFVAAALANLAALPGVEAAAVTHIAPFSGDDFNLSFRIVGQSPLAPGTFQSTLYYAISPEYLKAMGIPLRRGRPFTSADVAGAPRVTLINESLAKKYFSNEDPIGKRLAITNAEAEIVGIVADVKHHQLDLDAKPQAYEPFAQVAFNFMTVIVRPAAPKPGESSPSRSALVSPAAIRSAIYAVDKDQPVSSIRPLATLVANSVARPRFAMFLFAVFSSMALLLSALGIYGVMAYAVTQRTSEFGIRMALGAQRADVLRLVLGQGSRLVALGLVCGLAGALALTRFLTSMLFGVSPYDPLTFALIAALLAAVAALACLLPALRATKVDPLIALRAE